MGREPSAAGDGGTARAVELEHRLLDPRFRADAMAVRDLLHEDFVEVGASGRRWTRDAIVAELVRDPGHGATTSEVDATELAPGVVLVTYVATSLGPEPAVSRRSSLWIAGAAGGWMMRYHQGTPAA